VCDHVFAGEVHQIEDSENGKRVLSDRAIHYPGHGICSYETGWIVRGTPILVDLDLDDLGAFFGMYD
jgi:hypothetical protein